jgi:hypothetical protein
MKNDQTILGEHAVYPGHPVTLALCIVNNFPNWEAAIVKKNDIEAAVGCIEIPGAGGNVYAALDILSQLRKGMPFDKAMERADYVWGQCDDHKAMNKPRYVTGQEQADRFKDKLKEHAAWWTP